MQWIAVRPLSRLEKGLLYVFFLGVVPAFGALVEYRSAYLSRRMGDLDCFLRAAWAVRTGEDIYGVTSDNDWHYNYPPLCAILMTPLADPPQGYDKAEFMPYPISVAVCFLFNLLCLVAAAHFLASAFEQTSDDPSFRSQPAGCLRWWALRLWPVLICLYPIGHTMMRGQVNVLLLALLAGALASWMRGLNFRAGMWLAFAICIKVIPVYLLVYPLWKRDMRGLAGVAVGLLVGLGAIPLAAFGPAKTQVHYETYAKVLFAPLFKLNDDQSRRDELLGANSSDTVSVRDVLHNWVYTDRDTRPDELHPVSKAMYLFLGFAMTFVTLWPGTWRPQNALTRNGLQFASLILLMTIFSPVCHTHYLLFCMPIVMALMANAWQGQATIHVSRTLFLCLFAFNATIAVAYLPGMEILKDRCASLFTTLPLWGIPVLLMWRGTATAAVVTPIEFRKAA